MKKPTNHKQIAVTATHLIICTLLVLRGSTALAAAPQELVNNYANMCVTLAQGGMVGEADLKGNPKLEAYCSCFGRKFADRAVTKTTPPKSKEEIAALQKEELGMRNSCRAQYGLPPVPEK